MTKVAQDPTSISVSKEAYDLIEAEAERRGIAVSSLVELAVARELGTTTPPMRAFRRRRKKI